MNTENKFLKISRSLFFTLVFLIPINLGKHFIIAESYVSDLLVDYLIPTLHVQDILVIFIIFFWFLSGGFRRLVEEGVSLIKRKEIQFLTLFLFSLFLSVLSSQRIYPSAYFFLRIFLYLLLFLYILSEIKIEEYFFKILNIIVISISLLSLLGIAQYLTHGSVFDNYLFFGEQPYNFSTYGVAKNSFFGRSVLASYGTFSHPNVFGGYLSILLVWVYSFLKKEKLYTVSFILGVFTLFFTFSYVAWVVFILGILIQIFFSRNPKNIKEKKSAIFITVCFLCFLSILLPTTDAVYKSSFYENTSFYRRVDLIRASLNIFKEFPLFGVGLNNFTVFVDNYTQFTRDIRFTQPVHNVFLLVLAESGLFSIASLLLFLSFSFKRLINSSYFHVLFISMLQIIVLCSFDHYFFTIHQTQLLFWFILALALQ